MAKKKKSKVNVEKLMDKIKKKVGKKNISMITQDCLSSNLKYVNKNYDIFKQNDISSHRPWPIGNTLIKARNLFRDEINLAIKDSINNQVKLNVGFVKILNEMNIKISSYEKKLNKLNLMEYPSPNRLIICGCPRSGTTFVQRIVNHLPNTFITYELNTYMKPKSILNKIKYWHKWTYPENRYTMPKEVPFGFDKTISALGKEKKLSITNIENIIFNKKFDLVGDKQPISYLLNASRLLNKYSNLKIIYVYRDGRDVATSMKRLWGGKRKIMGKDVSTIQSCSKIWSELMRLWNEQYKKIKTEKLDNEVLIVKFEDLIHDYKKEVQRISRFLNKDVSKAMFFGKTNKRNPHVGYYKEKIPNWKKEFSKEGIKWLKKLDYV